MFMEALFSFGLITIMFSMLFVAAFSLKWLILVLTILTGDKRSLHDCGNLCEDEFDLFREDLGQTKNDYFKRNDNWKNWGEGNM